MDALPLAVVGSTALVLEGLKRVCSRSPFRIGRHHKSLAELWEFKSSDDTTPSGIILDAQGNLSFTTSDIKRIRESFPDAKIILMTAPSGCRERFQSAGAADGLVLSSSEPIVILKAIELILIGGRVFPAELLDFPDVPSFDDDPEASTEAPMAGRDPSSVLENLSEREGQVGHLLCNGSPNKIIARKLGISEATVKVHVKAILRKLHARNRTEAALMMNPIVQSKAQAS